MKKVIFAIIKIIKNPFIITQRIFCKVKSFMLTHKIDAGNVKITLISHFLKIHIVKNKSSRFIVNGNLRFQSHLLGGTSTSIILNDNSELIIDGDFVIGQNVKIYLSKNSKLYIGGKDKESDSGITSDCIIMTNKNIRIGKDFICAWQCFISDSDWHTIEGGYHQNIFIGDHVWIANNCNILKGSNIGNNCIVASGSKTSNKIFADNSIIGGTPAKVLKKVVNWKRDID